MKRGGMTFGLISILSAFIVLILAVFSVLSLASANSEANMTDKVLTSVTEYYTADTAAEEKLAKLDALLQSGGGNDELAELGVEVYGFGVMHLRYDVPINDGSHLHVELAAIPTNGDGWHYDRLAWSAVQNGE